MTAEKIQFVIEVDNKGAITSMKRLEKEAKGATTSMGNSFFTLGNVVKTSAVAAIALVSAKLIQLGCETLDYGDKLYKLNLRLGMSVEAMDKLKQLSALAGVEFKQVTTAITIMARNLDMARRGTGDAADALKSLGLDINELLRKKPEEQFLTLAEAIMDIEDPTIRNATAMKLLGRSAVELMSLFPNLRKSMEETNTTMSQDGVEAIALFNDNLTKMRQSIVNDIQPIIVDLAKTFNALYKAMSGDEEVSNVQKLLANTTSKLERRQAELKRILDKTWSKNPENLATVKRLRAEIAALEGSINRLKKSAAIEAVLGMKPPVSTTTEPTIPNKSKKSGLKDKSFFKPKITEPYDYEKALQESIKYGNDLANEESKRNDRLKVLADEQLRLKQENLQAEVDYSVYKLQEKHQKQLEWQLIDKQSIEDHDKWKEEQSQKTADNLIAFADQMNMMIANGMTDAIMDMIDGTKDFKDAVADMASAVIKELMRMIIMYVILAAVSGKKISFSGFQQFVGGGGKLAKGGIMDKGNIKPFASGGIVNGPTLFPMANGGTGLMGEAGPEAIIPLDRDVSGRLGVKSSGGGTVNNYNSIQAMDAKSFTEFMRSNPDALSAAMNDMANKGNSGFKNAVTKVAR